MLAKTLFPRVLPTLLVAACLTVVAGPARAGGPGADLHVGLSLTPGSTVVGADAAGSMSVENLGTVEAQDVVLTATPDPGLVPVVPEGCSWDGGDLTCLVGDIGPSNGAGWHLRFSATLPGSLNVVASASSDTPDPDPSDDSDSVTIQATGEACDVVGTQGPDLSLVAPPGGGVVCGLGGNDSLRGGPGDDELLGGSGLGDVASFGPGSGGVTADLLDGTATGRGDDVLAGVEDMVGTAFPDDLSGNAGANSLIGGGGADVLTGRGGDDELRGGAGGDEMDGGLGHDSLDLGGSPKPLRVDLAASSATGFGLDSVASVEDVVGSGFADVLAGNAAANRLEGSGGTDVLIGRGGDDVLVGGLAVDTLHAGAGDDDLFGGTGKDGCVQGVGDGAKAGCEIVAYAQYGDLVLFEPHVDTVGFGFHESLFSSAEILRPLGTIDLNANQGKYPNPPPPTDGPGYVVMGSRGRSTHPTTATDIVVPRHGTMRSPVTGTVVEVAIYQLYCDRPDWKVIIRPLTDPDLRVLVLHMEQPHVAKGDPVVAGVTDIGVAVENDPATAQENDYFPDQYPHVHIEVEHVGAVKGPCAA